MRFLGDATSLVEQHTGKSIFDDYETAMMASRAWDRILRYVGPRAPRAVVETIKDMDSFTPAPERPQPPSHKDGKPIVNWLAHMARLSSDEERQRLAEQWATYERELSEWEAQRQELAARVKKLDRYFERIANVGGEIADSIFAPEKQ